METTPYETKSNLHWQSGLDHMPDTKWMQPRT